MTSMRILQINTMILLNERKKFLFFLKVISQDHSFFRDLTGIFCTVGGTLVRIFTLKAHTSWQVMLSVDKCHLNEVKLIKKIFIP
jgi:hypothetical protein